MSEDVRLTIPEAHKRFAVDCFNNCWTYLEKPNLTDEEKVEMIHIAHASAYHWLQREDKQPVNRVRSLWQISRAYAVAGHPGAAAFYGQLCLEGCERDGIGDFDLAYAYEALARAAALQGDGVKREEFFAKAKAAAESIQEKDDRELFESDLKTIPEVPK